MIEQEEMQRVTGKTGWTYADLPKMTEELFQLFIDTAGEENLHWITQASYEVKGQTLKRGQVMISPKGLARGKKWAEENKT